MNKLEEQKRSKQSELKKAIKETRDLLNKEDASVDDIKSKSDKVKELKQEIEDLNTKIEALGVVNDSPKEGDPEPDKTNSADAEPKNDDKKNKPTDTPKDEKTGEGKMPTNLTQEVNKKDEIRSIENYVRSHGTVRDTGLKTGDIGPMIPEEIIYNPEAEINSVYDLSKLVTKTPAKTASGTYPILKRAVAVMNTVEELAESPELAKPEFEEVTWKISTYRGKIPISEESLQDTQVPLMPVIQRNASEQRLNTLNKAISDKLTTFNAKSSTKDTLTDDLKHILNVDLDPAYDKSIVVSQSAYQILDTLKDKQGRYLLQESITAASGITLFGKQVVVVNDELLGKVGESHIWIGDLKRAILYVNRVDTQITWVKNEIYGQYLGLVMRFDVEVADSDAGYFVTVDGETSK